MDQGNPVTVTDVDIPFGRLVVIFVKFSLAAIPAAFIVTLIMMVITAFIGGLFGGMGMMMGFDAP